jgi:hypothetical protein
LKPRAIAQAILLAKAWVQIPERLHALASINDRMRLRSYERWQVRTLKQR